MPSHVLHVAPTSAPCRAVLLHHALLGDKAPPLEVQIVDLKADQHKTPEFLALNPRHCVPTLETPYGVLSESRAIMIYFADAVQQVAPEDWTLYPRTIYQRARVHELLDWDQGSFYKAIAAVVYPKLFGGVEPTTEQLEALKDAFGFLDQHVLTGDARFLAGPKPTIADIAVAINATMLRLVNLEITDMPNVARWQQTMSSMIGWADVNAPFEQWCAELAAAAAPPAVAPSPTPPPAEAPASPPSPPEAPAAPAQTQAEPAPATT